MEQKQQEQMPGRPVLVTTTRRGVFFGYLADDADRTVPTQRLTQARMAIYWGTTGGVFQLAESGPTAKSRIGSRAPAVTLFEITAIIDVSPKAVQAWEAA